MAANYDWTSVNHPRQTPSRRRPIRSRVQPAQVKALLTRHLNTSERRVARQTFWTGATTAIRLASGLATVSITARVLGPDGYGVLAVIMSATGLIHGIVSLPGGDAVIAFVSKSVAEGRGDRAAAVVHFALAVSFGMSLLAYAVIVLMVFVAREFTGLREAYVEAVLLYGVLGVLGSTSSQNVALLRLADRVSLSTAAELASIPVVVGMIVLAWLTDGGLFAIVMAYVVGAIVANAGVFIATAASASRAGLDGFLRSPRFSVSRDVVRFQAGTYIRVTIGAITAHVDTILVGQLAGAPAAGMYRAAVSLVDTCRRPFALMARSIHSEFGRLWFEGRGSELRRVALRFTLFSMVVGAAGFALLAVLRGTVIEIVFGEDFSGAGSVMLILIPGALLSMTTRICSRLPIATGQALPGIIGAATALVVSVSLALLLIPQYGAEGAAWARTVTSVVGVAVVVPFVYLIIKQSYRIDQQA